MPLLILSFLLEIAFFSNLQYATLQNFLPIRVSYSGPSGDAKISKFLPYNFSRYNLEKLIRTMPYLHGFSLTIKPLYRKSYFLLTYFEYLENKKTKSCRKLTFEFHFHSYFLHLNIKMVYVRKVELENFSKSYLQCYLS